MRGTAARPAAVGAAALLTLLAGCGIRATSVPVDAGPAPSRATCSGPDSTETAAPRRPQRDSAGRLRLDRIEVFLVCNGQVQAVERDTRVRGDEALVADQLLAQLKIPPERQESERGYGTRVPSDLEFAPALPSDPAGTLRLSREPGEMQSVELGQVVCTLSRNLRADARVPLAGPDAGSPAVAYACDALVRAGTGTVAAGAGAGSFTE
ncbi:lipoprotein [Streptomyces capparidis]